ncbi:MAG: HDIG domain-containing protein [Verrucomicrobia bacterium]|nr:HDIG domain-containing protein [Verrucomicrobiota bacterium]
MNPPAPLLGRAVAENRLESDQRLRAGLFALSALLAYGLSLFTPAAHTPAAWIAVFFTAFVLPLVLSIVIPEAFVRNRLLGLFLLTLIGNFAFILLLLRLAHHYALSAGIYLLPPALAALTLTTLVGPRAGSLLVVLVGLAELFLLHTDQRYLVASVTTGLGAVILSQHIHRRSDLLKAGAGIGLVALFSTVLGAGLSFTATWQVILTEAVSAAALGLLGAILVGALLPVLESAFDRTTDLSWLELMSPDRPILRRLALEAPGTYLHSVLVGHLAEAAAAASGAANPRACRAMALFHDIGKLKNPEYFTENFTAAHPNPHASLPPSMSSLIILAHVKDGVALARQNHLPRRIREAIREHHGRTLVWYFYQRALQQEKDARSGGKILRLREEDIPEVEESSFRYPGPHPQSPETAILSLADAAESASRALGKPMPGDAARLVDQLFQEREKEGHWAECGLTASQWQAARKALAEAVENLLRPRIRYPKDRRGPKKTDPAVDQPSKTASAEPGLPAA